MTPDLSSLFTPCLLLDVARLDANIARMVQRLAGTGVTLRPHVKTCKSVEVMQRVFASTGGIGPITVSTLREAEYFAEAGFRDILYAVSIVPDKLERVAKIQESGATVHVILDDPSVASQVSDVAARLGCSMSVLIEIDCDGHRAGILHNNHNDVVKMATQLESAPNTRFAGVLTHAGESYECRSVEEIRAAAEHERQSISEAAARVEEAGLPCEIRSIGSSPTGLLGGALDGISELRAGAYLFQDLFQSNLGVCGLDEIAISVLCTVISHRRDKGWLITDAGALALSKDRSTSQQSIDYGYGLVCDLDGKSIDHLIVTGANQEHGIISGVDSQEDFSRYPISARLRIFPNHACMTAAAYQQYHGIFADGSIERWSRVNGW